MTEDAIDHEPARLLIVDSDHEVLEHFDTMARSMGHFATCVPWPVNVPRLLEIHRPDMVLLGHHRDETWAFELCADMRLLDPSHELPILLVVSGNDDETVELGLRAGADDVLRASIGARELTARVSLQLRNKRHRETLRSLQTERDHFKSKATVDPLTQVLNRGALEESLGAELARGGTFAVMFLDLDHFKLINDRFGHEAGDNVLRAVGAHLKRTIRRGDFAGRYGGEEFVVCLSGCAEAVAPAIAERHRQLIEQLSFPEPDHPEKVTASIGIAVFNPEIPDPSMSALLKRADRAVYQAKHHGRNRVVVATSLRNSLEEQSSHAKAQEILRRPLASLPDRSVSDLESTLISRLDEGHSPLPVIPSVALAGLRMAQRPNVNIQRLADLVEKDPFLAARFLAVANSAAYYRGFRTASMRDAVARIGLSEARDILSGVAYSASLPRHNDLLFRLAERSLLAARSAQLVCRELRLNYEPAYLCGLLHDLGEARVLRILATLPPPEGGMPVVHDLVERYHAQAGAQLAQTWNLHSDIVQACALHHDEEHVRSGPVRVAMLSDLFVRLASRPTYWALRKEDEPLWRKFDLTQTQVRNVLKALRG